MKSLKLFILIALVTVSVDLQAHTVNKELKTEKDSVSYGLGASYAGSLKEYGVIEFIDVDMFVQAFLDVAAGSSNKLTPEQIQAGMTKLQTKVGEKQQAEQSKAAQANKDAGNKFLAENKKKAGIKTTQSGLQYEVIKEGTGKSPKATDKVTVHYTGTLIDGTVFDSSVERGSPIDFPLNGVIPGWTEGVQLMKEGAKYKFYIPSDLAYGDRGQGQQIQPGSTLIFEVELIKVGE